MKSEILLNAIGNIDDELIFAAENERPKRAARLRFGAIAACICLIAAVTSVALLRESEPRGITIPPIELASPIDPSVQGKRVAYFNYDSGVYQSCYDLFPDWAYPDGFSEEDYVGRYVGTTVADKVTPPDGKIDFTGSISGELYTVKGYDPEFMLCMYTAPGYPINVFLRVRGITLEYGRDLIEKRMKLSKNLERVSYETSESYQKDLGELRELSDSELIERLFDEMNGAKFSLRDYGNSAERLCVLHFRLENGMTFKFHIFEDGSVLISEYYDVRLQLSQELLDELISQLCQ